METASLVVQLHPGRGAPGQTERNTIEEDQNSFPWFGKFSYQQNLPTLNPAILGRATSGRFNEVHELTQGLILAHSARRRSYTLFGSAFCLLTLGCFPGYRHSAYGRMLLARIDSTDAPERKNQSWGTGEPSSKGVKNAG